MRALGEGFWIEFALSRRVERSSRSHESVWVDLGDALELSRRMAGDLKDRFRI